MIPKFKIHSYLVVMFVLLTSGCTCNSYYNDRPEDVSEATQVTKSFYACLMMNKPELAYSLLSNRFIRTTQIDTTRFVEIIKEFDSTLGKVDNYQISNWHTSVVTGTNPSSGYIIVYDVNRGAKTVKETFDLEKENGQIKISRYNVEFQHK
jgi:hypothetical protein